MKNVKIIAKILSFSIAILVFTALNGFTQTNFPSHVIVENGANLNLKAYSGSSHDPGDIVFSRSDDNEIARIYCFYNPASNLNSMYFGFGPGIETKLVIAEGGNIGIGTTSPSEKLSVNGKIRAHEVKVEATNWPDYVFDQDYKILGLSELESYIKTNRHLPEMPSAKAVEIEGISVGDMIKLQQKKIEELTLYLIEKDKALKKEASSNIQNQKRIEATEKELSALKEIVHVLMKK